MRPQRSDWLLAAALAAALLLQLALHDTEGSAALNIAGGLLLTLPLAFRRQAPVAVIAIFCATAILNEALGGALFTFPEAGAPDQDPPLFASLAAGAVASYSVGVYADDRPAVAGLLLGVAGLWATVVASDQIEFANFIWSGGLIAATPWFAGRVSRSRRQRIASLELEREQRARSPSRTSAPGSRASCTTSSPTASASSSCRRRAPADARPRSGAGRAALATIEEPGARALAEMRRMLGVLRDAGEHGARPAAGHRRHRRAAGERAVERAAASTRGRGHRPAAAARGRPVRLPDRPGGAHQRAQARRPRPGRRARPLRRRRARRSRSPTTAPAPSGGRPGGRATAWSACASASRSRRRARRRRRAPTAASRCARGSRRGDAMSIRVLIADDQALVRGGFRMILEAEPTTSRWSARPPTAAGVERPRACGPTSC